jgi:HK97 family phage major capsid protein
MSIKFDNEKQYSQKLIAAMKSGDEKELQQAWEAFHASVAAEVKKDFDEIRESADAAVLAQRGYRQLTSAETKWYQKVITALRSAEPKQAFTAIIGSDNEEDLMPTTIIEDVYKNLRENHPILGAINFQYVGYMTKWVLNDHSVQKAVWGPINSEIVKEITSAFKTIDITQNKLSAYAVMENDMLDLGPTFLDGYIRTCLEEALTAGLVSGIIDGTGKNEPIGLTRDIHEGVEVSSSTGYPRKTAETVKDFTPKNYGALVAKMATNEAGKPKNFAEVALVCNLTDYLTKVMPASTVLTPNGTYARDVFPFPTKVYVDNALSTGEAILFIPGEYTALMGGAKKGLIEVSEEYKFLEDQTAFKIKQHGTGRALDNTSALLLDISGLEPAYITVKEVTTA